jgi:hypothetical protein
VANPLIRTRAHITGLGGGTGLFTQYFDGGATPGTAEGTEAGARVRALWESIKATITSNLAVVYDTGGDLIDPVTGHLVGSVGGTTPTTTTCTSGSVPLPWICQANLRMFTAGVVNNRRVNGRHYIPGYTTVADSNGRVASGTQTALLTAAQLLSTTIVTAITPVVWHRPKGAAPGAAYAVVTYSCAPEWASLRERRD